MCFRLPNKLNNVKDVTVKEVKTEKKHAKLALQLEKELEANPIDSDGKQFATLTSDKYVFQIMKTENVIGRRDLKDHTIDINLTFCGPASAKVSRRQATLNLTHERGECFFVFKNEGKKAIFVGDNMVGPGEARKLAHNDMVGFPGDIKFLFQVHSANIRKWMVDQGVTLGAPVRSTVFVREDNHSAPVVRAPEPLPEPEVIDLESN